MLLGIQRVGGKGALAQQGLKTEMNFLMDIQKQLKQTKPNFPIFLVEPMLNHMLSKRPQSYIWWNPEETPPQNPPLAHAGINIQRP